jgi:SAM-dependent methyltransferase
MSWVDFWDGDHSIYVNRAHLDAHYCRLVKDLVPLLPPAPFTLLDFGCGDALMAPELAAKGGTIVLHDAAPKKRDTLRARYGGQSGIQVLDDLAAQPDQSCDLVIMISVAQYIDRAALADVLAPLKRVLKPGGRLIVADIIPPGGSLVRDVTAFLGFAAGNGFLLAALFGLVRTLFSDYSRLRKQLGLSTYAVEDMVLLLGQAGWRVDKLPRNIGFDPNRWSAVAVIG